MKSLIALAALSFSLCSVAAEFTALKDGDMSLYSARAEITDVRPYCPPSRDGIRCMAYGSSVLVTVHLGGCVDRLAGYHSTFRTKGSTGILSFGAIGIANRTSLTARCMRENTVTVSVPVNFEGQVLLEQLEFATK